MDGIQNSHPSIDTYFPEPFEFLFRPSRYKVAYGGRASCKSWSFARALILLAYERMERILCTRELQVSIADSVHLLLCDQIKTLGLERWFNPKEAEIEGPNGSSFLFAGVRNNVTKIKSMEGLTKIWVEEAEKVSHNSWQVIIPTARVEGSEIWITFNTDQETDPTYQRFVLNTPPNCVTRRVSWRDNRWITKELIDEKDYLAKVDPDAYAHVWEGDINRRSHTAVFHGKYTIESFEPQIGWDGPYYGADWGFSQDPTALVKLWIGGRRLYFEHEAWGVKVDLNDTPALFDRVPGARDAIVRADSSRPETISHMRNIGYAGMRPADKWSGSVEDGIAFLRSFEQIVIHPRCVHTAQEARLYSYKVDRLTGDVLADIVDKHNHCWDAARYALDPIIQSVGKADLSTAFFGTEMLTSSEGASL